MIVEDGSTVRCESQVREYEGRLRLKYFYKDNEGRVRRATTASSVPMEAISCSWIRTACFRRTTLRTCAAACLRLMPTVSGGPDAAHESFTGMQKAINYSMTSFLTTGGIRGGKMQLEKFVPRTFNTGFSRDVYECVGGFREMFSEDIEQYPRVSAMPGSQ